jgi:hypothetical protein
VYFSEVLAEVEAAFAAHGVRWAVVGGVAISLWGIARLTDDLDFVVPGDQEDSAVAALESIGFSVFRRTVGFANFARASDSPGRIDLLFVRGQTAIDLFSRVGQRSAGTQVLPVVHAEHLVAMKLFAISRNPGRRARDLEDIRGLLARGAVDGPTILRYLERYGQRPLAAELGIRG